jgi:hypothetical protein
MANKNIKAVEQAPVVDKKQNITLEVYDAESGTYKHVQYDDIIGHQVGQNWVAVLLRDDETIIIPSMEIKQIRVWKE